MIFDTLDQNLMDGIIEAVQFDESFAMLKYRFNFQLFDIPFFLFGFCFIYCLNEKKGQNTEGLVLIEEQQQKQEEDRLTQTY